MESRQIKAGSVLQMPGPVKRLHKSRDEKTGEEELVVVLEDGRTIPLSAWFNNKETAQ